MSETAPGERIERIVVALDASPQSVAALEAAAELAALMEAEVEGLFVEDSGLLCLCGLPFSQEIDVCTTAVRPLEAADMERQLRVMATSIERTMEQVAGRAAVRWSFRVRRGAVVEELLAAAQDAALMSVGRAGRVRRRGLGSTARLLVERARRPVLLSGERGGRSGAGGRLQEPLTVLYTGTPAAGRALDMALRLRAARSMPLRVLVWAGGDASPDVEALEETARRLVAAAAGDEAGPASLVRVAPSADPAEALRDARNVRDVRGGTLVVPHEQAALVAEDERLTLLVP
jgi:nucleotide-binding universal stress UspA family protein